MPGDLFVLKPIWCVQHIGSHIAGTSYLCVILTQTDICCCHWSPDMFYWNRSTVYFAFVLRNLSQNVVFHQVVQSCSFKYFTFYFLFIRIHWTRVLMFVMSTWTASVLITQGRHSLSSIKHDQIRHECASNLQSVFQYLNLNISLYTQNCGLSNKKQTWSNKTWRVMA